MDIMRFTNVNSDEMIQFEKKIGYFYEAANPELIAQHYIMALQTLEKLGIEATEIELEQHMLPALQKAYSEVLKQTQLQFDISTVAKLEFSLILAQSKKASFETINNIMVELYRHVFDSDDFSIRKAAMLRTFLFQYKVAILQSEKSLSSQDMDLLLSMAKLSEVELRKQF